SIVLRISNDSSCRRLRNVAITMCTLTHPRPSHGSVVMLRFVIATRVRYFHRDAVVIVQRYAGLSKAAGVHPPTTVPGAYGAPRAPGAPLLFLACASSRGIVTWSRGIHDTRRSDVACVLELLQCKCCCAGTTAEMSCNVFATGLIPLVSAPTTPRI